MAPWNRSNTYFLLPMLSCCLQIYLFIYLFNNALVFIHPFMYLRSYQFICYLHPVSIFSIHLFFIWLFSSSLICLFLSFFLWLFICVVHSFNSLFQFLCQLLFIYLFIYSKNNIIVKDELVFLRSRRCSCTGAHISRTAAY